MHTSVAEKFWKKYKPLKLRLKTVTKVDEDAIIGIEHQKFYLVTPEGNSLLVCAKFMVTSKLNGMESILGAEFLFCKVVIAGINKNSIMFEIDNVKTTVTIWREIECRDKIENPNFTNFLDIGCKSCRNANGKIFKIHYTEIVSISHSYWEKESVEIQNEECRLMKHLLKDEYKDKKMPDSEQMFDNKLELKFEALDKVITLDMGDYSHCLKEWR